MTSLGIMTLSRGPYNELDKMSLFQDLKLKRRKVDSRCSSDGESLADTSTSSPDLVVPLSPKMCDQLTAPNQKQVTGSSASLEDDLGLGSTAADSGADTLRVISSAENDAIQNSSSENYGDLRENAPATGKILSSVLTKDLNVATAKVNINNGNRSHEGAGKCQTNGSMQNPSVIRSLKSERIGNSSSPPIESARSSPLRPSSNGNNSPHTINHSNYSNSVSLQQISPSGSNNQSPSGHNQVSQQQQQHVTVLVNPSRVKAEQEHQSQHMIQHHQTTIVGIRRNSPPANPNSRSFGVGGGPAHLQTNFRDIGSGNVNHFSPAIVQAMNQSQHLHNNAPSGVRGQMAPNSSSGSHQMPSSGSGNQNVVIHNQMAMQLLHPPQMSQMRIKRERSPTHGSQVATATTTTTSAGGTSVVMSSTQHETQVKMQSLPQMSTMSMLNPHLQMRHPLRDAAVLLRVKNEVPHLVQTQQRMVWNAARINGVKPEIIGGPLPNMRTNGTSSPPASQTHPRATPTVIMGESCGVRTMVWGFEPSNNQSSSPASSSSNQSPVGPSQNEEAAQLLLSLGQTAANRPNEMRSRNTAQRSPHPLNMERLWAGDYSQLPAGQQMHALNLSQAPQWLGGGVGGQAAQQPPPGNKSEGAHTDGPQDEDDQPLVCMICEDKATGLHYGIITCEGCKGFFKRTVQNRRVYTCVADGTCEITKAQRNRCQYCRFKKCIEQGMVLQAVREDRMPGGRNSGAVYNLYKVKYKKHKKVAQKPGTAQHQLGEMPSPPPHQHQLHHSQMAPKLGSNEVSDMKTVMFNNQSLSRIKSPSSIDSNSNHSTSSNSNSNSLPSHLMNGTILKTALTNPSEIIHLRHRLDNAVSSSKDRSVNYEHALCMIQTLIDCDEMENIATLPHFPEFLEDKSEIGDKLCNIGDSIVHKLVSWTKKLPFYLEIPVEIHTKLLTDKWHELLVLTTAAYQALHGRRTSDLTGQTTGKAAVIGPIVPEKGDPEFVQEVTNHLCTLQTCLTTLMGQPISMEQLRLDVGHMVEKMTQITIMFRRIKLKMEEYVCLKVYILLNKELELEGIQERYVQVLRSFLQNSSPHNPGRLNDLLAHIPEIQAAASLLLESKMFYVPFVLNSASIR